MILRPKPRSWADDVEPDGKIHVWPFVFAVSVVLWWIIIYAAYVVMQVVR